MENQQTVFYTIGVLGSSDLCEYTLTAIQNSFQVYEPNFSKIYTTRVSKDSPLVFRNHWKKDFIKVFYYSADSLIEIKEGFEAQSGIFKVIEELKSKAASQWTASIGKAFRYNSSRLTSGESNLIAAYPRDQESGEVSIAVSHPLIPIKVSPLEPAVRVVLDNNEHVLIEPFVDLGELNEFTITVGGTTNHTSFTYNSK